MTGLKSRRIDVGGHALHVEDIGTGPPVLLLHGFTGSTRTMRGLASGLVSRHRVVSVDLLGHGRSDAPDEVSRYRMERCVADLGRVLEALEAWPAHVLGYSMGGRVALGLAVLRPALVRSVVAIGASAGLTDPAERAARVASDEALARSILEEGLEPFVTRWMALPLFATQRRLGPVFWKHARTQRLANDPRGLAGSLRGLGVGAQPALHAKLFRVAGPTLLVVGEDDAKFRAIANDLARRLADARVAMVPRAGHAAHVERPRAVLARVRRFFREQTPAPPARGRLPESESATP